MNMRRGLALAFATATFAYSSTVALHCQEDGNIAMTSEGAKPLSDREKSNLRGPVRSVIEESLQPAWTDGDGKVYPESRSWRKTEYDREGRTAETRFRGSTGEWVTRYTYAEAGMLLRTIIQDEKGETKREIVYKYDQGRLLSITDTLDPDNPIAFHYDANGRKTKVAIARLVDERQGPRAVSRSMEAMQASFEDSGSAPALPEGGSAVTLYDEHDRPAEIQSRNSTGEIISRTLRVYDDQGRVVEEKQTMDDPLKLIPGGDQKKIFASEKVTPQELRDQLAQFLGGGGIWSTKYTYDAQGRRSNTIHGVFNHVEDATETAYNEHGDVAKETNKNTMRGTPNGENDGTRTSETIYSYLYDSYGNWTFKKRSSHSTDGAFKDAGDEVRRTIEYF